MSRSLVTLRTAEASDALFLAELWASALRRADRSEQVADLEQVIKTAAASAEQRLVVADYDGQPAGAVLLKITTVTSLNLDPAVQVLSPHVAPAFRRHGIGRMLMECAATFAEEAGVPQVCTAVAAGSRDGNRFMARLALGPLATYRVAPVTAVRARLTAQRPTALVTAPSGSGRQLSRVLAARRSMRRAEPVTPPPS
ncbi:GNAT family N-acetyltransferase [Nocardioides sp.]|uniref:GNAT family N-acetyltransferase n=1 Tax=Nocardioides sp. TaxID=35761 RepID=UPI0027257D66|nr:GNAT family N-acetyltransferase [Nocardioides sp.]MDO9455313.1 GNAT family N-acetyltransferase [Nocardioides sp.]